MKKAARSPHFWIAIVLVSFFSFSASVISNTTLLILTNSLLLAASTAVGVAYVPVAWHAMRNEERPAVQHIALGIAYAWIFSAIWRCFSIFWLMADQPMFLVNNDIVAMCQAGIALGAFYHLTSPGAISWNMPRMKWIILGCVIGAALGLSVLLASFTPNEYARALAEVIRPYIPH